MDVYSSLRFYKLVNKEKLIICDAYSLKQTSNLTLDM